MWKFCLHSLFREYGWQFIRRVAVRHPVKTARAILHSSSLDFSGDTTVISNEAPGVNLEGESSIVGVGFCLKPMYPPCLSGRSNHDCHYLEHLLHSDAKDIPPSCRQCEIKEFGIMTLKTGAAFYIMTSAKDILFDVFAPSLDERRFSSGLFVLCRYSLTPFAVGMLVSNIRGRLFTFERGDCRDYKTWLMADRGIKEEQTAIIESKKKTIRKFLDSTAKESTPGCRFKRRGNIFYPKTASIF